MYLRLLRTNRDFRLLFFATLISLGGDWFLTVALLDLVLELTGSATLVSLILLFQTLPIFLFTPHAGHLVDRVDRRKLMIGVDLLRIGACLLPLLARTPAMLPFAFAGVFLIAAGSAYFEPAAQAALPNIVSAEELAPANVLMGSTWGTMLAAGAGIGGAVTAILGRDASFLFDAASFALSAIFLARMRVRFSEELAAGHERPPFLESVRETFRFARAKPRVLGLLTVKGGYGLGAGVVAMLSVFGREVFRAGALGIGLLFAARGIGALLGPFMLRATMRNDDAQYRAIAWCIIGFAAGYAGLAISTALPLGFLAILFAHLGGGAAWQISTYGLQREVPDAIRGRIFSADYGLVTLTMAISGLASGIASDRFGPTAATLGTASVCLLFGIIWAIATWKLWRQATVLVALLVFLGCAKEKPQPPVILISIDTLRSDHLPAYGYRAIATPHIDRLAADGIVYERAFSHVPLTLPSHASIFTGLLPAHHGVRDNAGFRLDAKTPTIASMLRAHGYATGGFVSAYVLRSTTNVSLGFDAYDDRITYIEGAPMGNVARAGREAVESARRWLSNKTAQPFFAFVHLFEPHAPYEPSYDGEIAKTDALVGELLDSLRASGVYDNALIILLSDHGEGLREHGEQEHGVLLYRESLQVPLIVKLPKNEQHGKRIAEAVQLVDVLPTIAAVTGATAPTNDGHSLLEPPTPRPIFSETLYPRLHLGWSDLRSLIEWPHHLIDGPKPELYDAARDPHETRDLRASDRRVYAKLHADMAAAPTAPAIAQRIDAEEAKKLAALGYVSAQSQSAAPSTLNPRDHLRDLDALKQVTELMAARRFAEAAALMERLLVTNPGWSDLRDQLGVAYEEMHDLPRAEKTYRDAIRTTPELAPQFALSLAGVLLERGALDDAEAHARLALEENPRGAEFVLAQILLAKGDAQGALASLRRLYSMKPLPNGYFALAGDVFEKLGRHDEARMAYEQALQLHPEDEVTRRKLAAERRAPRG